MESYTLLYTFLWMMQGQIYSSSFVRQHNNFSNKFVLGNDLIDLNNISNVPYVKNIKVFRVNRVLIKGFTMSVFDDVTLKSIFVNDTLNEA